MKWSYLKCIQLYKLVDRLYTWQANRKAGAMHTAMTNVVAQKIEEAGEEPLAYKLPEGGIQGVCT